MNIGQKIKLLREARNITLQEIGDLWGISRSSVAGWESGAAKPGIDKLPALARRLGTTVDELLSERDLPTSLLHPDWGSSGTAEEEVVEALGGAGASMETLRRIVAEIERTEQTKPPVAAQYQGIPGARQVHVVDENSPGQYLIPRVTLRLQAGITGFQSDVDWRDGGTVGVSRIWVENKGFDPTRLISMDVKGESMEPTIYEGDTVVINLEETQPVDNYVYAVNYEGEAVIKRLSRDMGKWWLLSDNPDQRRYYRRACQGSECIIIGRVVRRIGDHL